MPYRERGVGRMILLSLKEREATGCDSLALLRNRRESMVRELFAVAGEAVVTRDALLSTLRNAWSALALSLGAEGRAAVESAAIAARREISVTVSARNFWGMRLPEVRWQDVVRAADARGYAFPGVSSATDAAAREYEKALEAVFRVVAVETRFRRIGAEIAKTTRRINVLNEVILPGLRSRIRTVRLALEEREREEVFRMKRFKRSRRPEG